MGYADDFERMELLAHTYEAQAEFLGGTDQIPEAVAAIEKMIAIAEQYWRAHPDEKRANNALASVYNNAGSCRNHGCRRRVRQANHFTAAQVDRHRGKVARTRATR